jgi:pSer/pThr/pTyr-binding forkhead associated (FHA) protein
MGKIILEILDHFGRVRERHQVKRFPFTIGRGYDNDIILDDPYISPQHLVLDGDGENTPRLKDLNSTNGSYLLPSKTSFDESELVYDQKIRLGHTTIRFRDSRHNVKLTQVDRLRASLVNDLLSSKLFFIFFELLFIGFLALQEYQGSTGEYKFGHVIFSEAMPMLIVLAIWAGIWAIFSRISSHYFYFRPHMLIVTIAIFSESIFNILFSYLSFAFSTDTVFEVMEYLTSGAILALMLFGHLRFVSIMHTRKLAIISLLLSASIIGLMVLNQYVDQRDFSASPGMDDNIKAPYFRIAPAIYLDDFLKQSQSLQ